MNGLGVEKLLIRSEKTFHLFIGTNTRIGRPLSNNLVHINVVSSRWLFLKEFLRFIGCIFKVVSHRSDLTPL